MRMDGRPLDVLEDALQSPVRVRLKGGEQYRGALVGYDQHMNLVLEPAESDPDAAADAGSVAGDGVTSVEDTTVIRGDNVVTIKA